MPGIVLVEMHQEGRHDEEEKIRHSVDELSDVGGESVILLAPVNWTGPSVKVAQHCKGLITNKFT